MFDAPTDSTMCQLVRWNWEISTQLMLSRMGQDRYPKLALEGYVHGQRGRGRPKKRWLDVVRSDCADMGRTVHDAIHLAQDRDAWRRSIAKLQLRAPVGASPRHQKSFWDNNCALLSTKSCAVRMCQSSVLLVHHERTVRHVHWAPVWGQRLAISTSW